MCISESSGETSKVLCMFLSLCNNLCWYIYMYWPIGIMVRLFTNGLGDQGSISGQVIPKTQKIVLNAFLLGTHSGL